MLKPQRQVPPNAKYRSQDPSFISHHTGSTDPEDMRYDFKTTTSILVFSARIFAGCLNLELCTREDVIELFSMYGPIKGTSFFPKGGYSFVQFENAQDAEDAVLNLNRYMFQGVRLGKSTINITPLIFRRQACQTRRQFAIWPRRNCTVREGFSFFNNVLVAKSAAEQMFQALRRLVIGTKKLDMVTTKKVSCCFTKN